MNLYSLTKSAYKTYTTQVKGNSNLDETAVQKKLTRNIMLSRQIHTKNKIICFYGNLRMVVKGDTIIHIDNLHHNRNWFHKDQERYNMLNQALGIGEYEAASQMCDLMCN